MCIKTINHGQYLGLVFLLFLSSVSPISEASTEIERCDVLAANPDDKNRVAPGVPWGKIKAEAAIKACTSANKLSPELIRIQYQLARSLLKNKKNQKALKLYHRLAQIDYAAAQSDLAWMYLSGTGIKKNDAEALKFYRKSAEQGYASAQYYLGSKYSSGQGVTKNMSEAFKWYRKSAEQGNVNAQNYLGWMYANGQGVTRDNRNSVSWYRKAAEQGNSGAQFSLGLIYENGRGITKDATEAFKWYLKAAEQGHAIAQNNLGLLYVKGRGIEKNYEEALKWFRLASDKNNANAQYHLGLMNDAGLGVVKSNTEAVKWYRKAAEQGFIKAQQKLGDKYNVGQGVEKNVTESIKWYRKAAHKNQELTVEMKDAKSSCFHVAVPFNIIFPIPMNKGDVLEIYNDEARVLRYFVDGNLGIKSFGSEMKIMVKSNLTFMAYIGGKLYMNEKEWDPLSTLVWYPKIGSAKTARVRKIAKKGSLKVLLGNPMGFDVYIKNVSISTPKGSARLVLSSLISLNPFLQLKYDHDINESEIKVTANISKAPSYEHAINYLTRYKRHLIEGRANKPVNACVDDKYINKKYNRKKDVANAIEHVNRMLEVFK